MTQVEQRLRKQADQCAAYGSPLTGALLHGAADDYVAGGVMRELLEPYADEPSGSVLSLRFAGAMHRLVLERKAPELALHYPSVGGAAPVSELWPAAERAVRQHLEELRELITNPVQTNEVGRSAVLYGALQMLGGPIRLLEIGASAGLNLRCDAYPQQPWTGTLHQADEPPVIVERRGCDPAPLDPATPGGRLTLTSYVWADQVERLERLRTAIELARQIPAEVEQAHADDFLRRELADLPEGVTTVVWHSVVWQYMHPAERQRVDDLLAAAGARATDHRRLARVSLEPERVGESYTFQVHVQTWPGGERVHVADASGHGPPIHWLGATLRA